MSDRITGAMLTGSTLNDINASLSKLQRNAAELSSGHSILEASDNPYGASRTLDLQSQLDGLGSYATGVSDGISWTSTAGGAMANMNTVLQRVRELMLQAGNDTNGPGDLKNLATVVGQLTETVKQDANIKYGDQYLFSGTLTSTAPYAQGENDEYHGNEAQIARAIGPGATVTVSTDISSVLGNGQGSGDGKLLDVLRTIQQHMNEGTAESRAQLVGSDLKALDEGMEGLTQLSAIAGSANEQLQVAAARIESLEGSIEKALSNTYDTDFAKATIEYSNQQAAYQAALHAGANIVQESLLNFLR
jgi:flagellar hook-associated protein 3 FlgL